jgi:FixJ family two-component response regulator
VLLARDGEEAVSIFSVEHSTIAMVVLDVIMPRRGGPEVHATIAALSPDIPVMFVTGYSKETAVLTEMMDRGIVVLQKPYSPWALCRLVRKTLDRVAIHSSTRV